MRASSSVGVFVALVSLGLVAACGDSPETSAPPATEVGAAAPLPAPDSGAADAGAGGADSAQAPKNDCKLAAVAGSGDITPAFVVNSASTPPPTMTGGTLHGEYKVDAATVVLPSGSAGLVNPAKSTGTVNAWAKFDGTNYRLYLKSSFVLDTVAGPQAQGADNASQGGFTVSGALLALDHACDTAIAAEAEYSFTDTGGGRATLLIKTPTPYGDTYLQLDAAKN